MRHSPATPPLAFRATASAWCGCFARTVGVLAVLGLPQLAFPASTAATAATAPTAPAHVAPVPRWQPFDAGSWARLQRELPRPAVVVFTTTDCAHCPAALEKIDRARHAGSPVAALVVVVMDIAPGDGAVPGAGAYRTADRLMAFDGPERSLRYTVDPHWTGVTPYVALLPPDGSPRFVMGAPGDADWSRMQAGAGPRR